MKRLFNKSSVPVMVIAFALTLVLTSVAAQKSVKLSKQELKALIANAKTPADHEKLAAHYRAEAEHLKAEQEDHAEEAAAYFKDPSSHPVPKWPTMGQHCKDLAASYGMAAQKALSLADSHEKMAQEAK